MQEGVAAGAQARGRGGGEGITRAMACGLEPLRLGFLGVLCWVDEAPCFGSLGWELPTAGGPSWWHKAAEHGGTDRRRNRDDRRPRPTSCFLES